MSDDTNNMIYLCYSTNEQILSNAGLPSVSLVHFSNLIGFAETVKESLINRGWRLTTHHYTMLDLPPETHVLVLDDVSNPLLPTISADQWRALLRLIGSGHKILWVTSGSQFQVSDPQNAMFHGFARSARAEDPMLVLKTLDVESSFSSESFEAINTILLSLPTCVPGNNGIENEYCERGGIIRISRLLPDDAMNQAERDSSVGAALQSKLFHGTTGCIRMQCERLGAIDSLHYSEVSTTDLPLDDDFVEVEIYAAGLNYKVSLSIELKNFGARIADSY